MLDANPLNHGAQQLLSKSPLLSSLSVTRPKYQTKGTTQANARSLSPASKAKHFITVHAKDRWSVFRILMGMGF